MHICLLAPFLSALDELHCKISRSGEMFRSGISTAEYPGSAQNKNTSSKMARMLNSYFIVQIKRSVLFYRCISPKRKVAMPAILEQKRNAAVGSGTICPTDSDRRVGEIAVSDNCVLPIEVVAPKVLS